MVQSILFLSGYVMTTAVDMVHENSVVTRLGITNYVVTFFVVIFVITNYDVILFFCKAKNVAAPGLHGQQSQSYPLYQMS